MTEFRASDLLTFERLVTTRIVRSIYFLGLAGLGVFTLLGLLEAFSTMRYSLSSGLGHIAITAGLLALGVLVWRIVCECLILWFSIHDRLTEIRDRTSPSQ
jgi:hypothetical protein